VHTDFTPISCDTLSQRDRRSLIFHLLYAVDAFDYQASLDSIVENFAHEYQCIINKTDTIFFTAQAIVEKREELDASILPLLENWKFERLSVSTRLILRYAMWELLFTDTAPNIVINEAVELAKCFAEKDAYKFINGILDEWRKRNRPESEKPEAVE
jgi:transcription antitermination protein NusB